MRVDTDTLGDKIAEHVAHIDAAMHLLLTDLREFDQAGGWARQGAQSCAHWLSWRVGWSLGTAREHVRVANRLAELPQIDDALRRGEVSYSKVRAMTRVASTANEFVLLEEARLTTGEQLETICRKYAMVQRHRTEANPADDRERRHVTRSDTSDGMVRIAAVLHPEEAAMVWAALERIVKEGHRDARSAHDQASPRHDAAGVRVPAGTSQHEAESVAALRDAAGVRVPAGTFEDQIVHAAGRVDGTAGARVPAGTSGDPGPHANHRARGSASPETLKYAQRFSRADALVTMAQEILRGTRSERSPTELVVTIPADRLTSTQADDDPSDVGCCADGTAVSLDVVRRLACDAGIVAVVEGAAGEPLSVGRKTRAIPGSMKRALLRRDQGCRFPGCSNRLFVEGHHLKHWADGGETKLTNLVSICTHHHRFVHEYGYRITIRDHEITFVDPRGRLIVAVPDPVRPADQGLETIRQRNAHLDITERTIACESDGKRLDLVACIDVLVRADDK